MHRTFSIGINATDVNIPPGNYIVFLFEIRTVGVRSEIDFYGVPINVQSLAVFDGVFESIPRLLSSIQGFPIDNNVDGLDIDSLHILASDYLSGALETKRRIAAEENRYIVESRIEALKRSSESKINRLQTTIDEYIAKNNNKDKSDSFYPRITAARIDKEKSKLNSEIQKLQNRKELSMDYNLEAIVNLEVKG